MAKYTGPEFEHCDRCPEPAGQLVRLLNGTETALCYRCWKPLSHGDGDGSATVLHWINRYGRFMFADGATTGPFRIKHR